MLASHGEQSTRVEPTTQRDVTGTSDSASELPAGNVSPQRAVTEPEAAASNLPDSSTATESKQASGEPAPAAAVTFDAPAPLSSVGDFKSARAATGESHDAASGEASPSPEGTVVSLDAVRAANAEPAVLEPPKPAVTRRAPIELDDLPATDDAPMQLASTWEFVGWQGSEGNGTIGHVAENTWEDRAVDLDGTVQRAAPASELPLASAWDFIQQPWQPQAREQSEALRALLAATDAPVAPGSEGPAVSAEQVLTALEDVGTQGVLGKVLLAYCAGRFQRAFLLGESFGLVRVGHAWGPGCDSPQVSALKVDLEAPSLLMSALEQLGPSSFDTPTCPQDEAIFSALGGPSSRLLVVPIRARGRPVAFVIADSGGTPVASTTLDELSRVSAKASEVYDRLPASRAD
ncbi:general secretion pathway protein GspE [Myxococcus sp. CA040A]|uniref:general secretion pathway protein GspE n=1 Tax=Myxococcus sp. CA040A TaxID=2741738 RepID=UPI0020C5EFEE|nr:general secretion pathway protein GspE [Myxococcus sp. CA040A]